jgi:long-chain acyl-CoA synthetase
VLIGDLLRHSAKAHSTVSAVDDGQQRYNFRELEERVERLAAGLQAHGTQPGDRVALLTRNHADSAALYFACARIAAVMMPLNWRLKQAEVSWILSDCPARVLVADADFAEAAANCGAARFLFDGTREGWSAFAELASDAAVETTAIDTNDVAIQMYTSGTTGNPKGAMLTHGNVLSLTEAWLFDMPLQPALSRFLQVTPLFHVGGMLMLMSTVMAGATLHLLPEFEPVQAIETLIRERITHTLMVPSMIQWTLLEPALRGKAFPDLELIVYGASPMPVAVLERAMTAFGCDFLQGYGLTETAGVALTLRPEDHRYPAGESPPRRLAAAGRAVQCSDVRVVDESGDETPVGETGEIVVRGPNVTPGYWNAPDATREALRDGWFHTGDLATRDDKGFIYVVDRLKDMILVGGENVYPREIEDVLMAADGVADAAVIGAPHDVWGEEVIALVVPKAGADLNARALIRHCRASLARFKCPTQVKTIAELPRNAAGKLLKRELREPYWKDHERRV